MPLAQSKSTTEGSIWDRLLQPEVNLLSVEAAESWLRLEFAAQDKERMHELAAKARDGALSSDEQQEIREYERVGNLLALLKSKARQRLKKPSPANGAKR